MGTFKDLKQTKANQAFIHPDKRVKVLKPLLAFEDGKEIFFKKKTQKLK